MIRLVSLSPFDAGRSQRTAARGGLTLALSAALAALAACGDPLVTAAYRGDPIFSVRGTVTKGALDAPPSLSQEVGVLWLNLLDDNSNVLVEATPADVIGNDLPVGFDVSVLQPPSDRMLGTSLVGNSQDASFEEPVDRNRVAFGIVVVAPEGTFARLPDAVSLGEFINASDATTGPLLSQFTYVSPFTVRYVKGASADGLTIRDSNGVESALEGITLFDISDWASAIDNAVCRDRRLGEGWQAPAVQECIASQQEAIDAADAEQQACLDSCQAPSQEPAVERTEEEAQASSDCSWSCYITHNGRQAIENECLITFEASRADETDALCGPPPDPDSLHHLIISPLDADQEVILPLGEGDVRSALTYGGFSLIG